jgi:hypothetical protein
MARPRVSISGDIAFPLVRALVVLLAPLLCAAAPARYDLVCVGTEQTNGASRPFSIELRIDLEQSVFCRDECDRTFKIDQILPDRLILSQINDDVAGKSSSEVDRVKGTYRSDFSDRNLGLWGGTQATCTLAPFKPFPTARF